MPPKVASSSATETSDQRVMDLEQQLRDLRSQVSDLHRQFEARPAAALPSSSPLETTPLAIAPATMEAFGAVLGAAVTQAVSRTTDALAETAKSKESACYQKREVLCNVACVAC
jgi:3-polyprenyl-4-hydroxybenzoate decarboxylase